MISKPKGNVQVSCAPKPELDQNGQCRSVWCIFAAAKCVNRSSNKKNPNDRSVRKCEFARIQILLTQRKSGLTGCAAAMVRFGQWQLRAAREDGPIASDFDGLSDCQCIFQFNAKVLHCAVHLRVSEEQLNST